MNIDELLEMSSEELDELLEKETRELMEESSEGGRRRLEGISWQMDMIRLKHDNPIARSVEMSRIMINNLLELNKALEKLKKELKVS